MGELNGDEEYSVNVPPGFRFHPTDEELLYYYLTNKVSYEHHDHDHLHDVIRELDLNKLEPWDLKEKCRIGCGHQNEWYFFSHKDKKYPTGTRTNRATSAGFWKATGRDKAIHMPNSKTPIGMRKTLVFYTGRAPHGQKTDWIMHEYRLQDDHLEALQVQEDHGWVVCRVFKKKTHKTEIWQNQHLDHNYDQISNTNNNIKQHYHHPYIIINNNNNNNNNHNDMSFHGSMQLPRLFSPDSSQQINAPPPCPQTQTSATWRLTAGPPTAVNQQDHRPSPADWSFLNRLLASSNSDQQPTLLDHFPFPHYSHFAPPPDFLKFSK